jgi:hypothetical protein
MCSFKVYAREKGKKKLKNDDKLLEVNITISVGCSDIPTKMLAIMEKFIEDICQDCVLWKEEQVFQDFTCRWCVGLNLKYGSCFVRVEFV